MIFFYEAVTKEGQQKKGTIDAITQEAAIGALQRRGFIISKIVDAEKAKGILDMEFTFLQKVKQKDLVIISRQLATLFGAQVSALKVFQLLGGETENKKLARVLLDLTTQIQGGNSIAASMVKHPDVFSDFYVSMVRTGEESGRLDETFEYLAEYLDRSYKVMSKAKNALVYPAFIVFTFVVVMLMMFTVVIPKISGILVESGQDLPIYTKVVLGISNFLTTPIVWGLALPVLVVFVWLFIRWQKTPEGAHSFDSLKLNVPYVGHLYRMLYLSRLSDNLNTTLMSGIPMIKSLELTRDVIDNNVFKDALDQTIEDVRGGSSVSSSFSKHPEFPNVLVQMVRVGEETGSLGKILKTLSDFYEREMRQAVDTLVGLIEPVMIILLGVGVGFLLASVLVPIYSISSAF